MRAFIFVCTILLSSISFGEDVTPKTEPSPAPKSPQPAAKPQPSPAKNEVPATGNGDATFRSSDLLYRPHAKKLFVTGAYSSASGGSDVKVKTGTFLGFDVIDDYYESKDTSSTIALSGGYGVTDSFWVTLQVSQGSTQSDLTYKSGSGQAGTTATLKTAGMGDPVVGLNYAVAGGKPKMFTFDIGVDYSPAMIEAKLPSATVEGTRGRGGTALRPWLQIGRQHPRSGWYLSLSQTSYGEKTVKSPSGGDDTKVNSSTFTNLDYSYQWKIGESFSLDMLLGYGAFSEGKSTSGANTTTTGAYGTSVAAFGLSYDIEPSFSVSLLVASRVYTGLVPVKYNTTEFKQTQKNTATTAIGLKKEF